MLAQLTRLFIPPAEQAQAQTVYMALVKQARRPVFYTDMQVPDTLDGRFELILLHLFLLLYRLQHDTSTSSTKQQRLLLETFFADMDRSIRELGVSDTGVGKRVKKMAAAFYGRRQAYEEALLDPQALQEALRRNLYGTVEQIENHIVTQMQIYTVETLYALQEKEVPALLNGELAYATIQHQRPPEENGSGGV